MSMCDIRKFLKINDSLDGDHRDHQRWLHVPVKNTTGKETLRRGLAGILQMGGSTGMNIRGSHRMMQH